MKTKLRIALATGLAAAAVTAMTGCSDNSMSPGDAFRGMSATKSSQTISVAGDDGCGDLPTAPDSVRVDLIDPVFSDPIDADNPLFPVGELDRAILLGLADGEPFRTETTRMPGTKTIYIDGKPVETIISQYVAWQDRRIHEVAIDWYGQDDEGNVYYFGEDVFNYEDGVVVDTHGTWIAGDEFPVAMIMPADPQVGDVWRPENACPMVFEEVTALETDVTVDGPRGPVAGALLVRELHLDGVFENKTFAPGYGELSAGSVESGNLEALAVAVPTDFLGGKEPEDLEDVSDGAEEIFRVARNGSWRRIKTLFRELEEDWEDYEATGVPPLLAAQMNEAIGELSDAIVERDRAETRQGAVDVALASVDFELRYDERSEIDLDLIEVWTMQLRIDVAAHDVGGIRSDLETIRVIRDRLEPGFASRIDGDLSALRSAAQAGDEGALATVTASLHEAVVALGLSATR